MFTRPSRRAQGEAFGARNILHSHRLTRWACIAGNNVEVLRIPEDAQRQLLEVLRCVHAQCPTPAPIAAAPHVCRRRSSPVGDKIQALVGEGEE